MRFQVEKGETWEDFTKYAEKNNFEGTVHMEEGASAGTALSALRILDDLTEKVELSFTSTWLSEDDSNYVQTVLRRRPLAIRTDYFGGTLKEYSVVCDNVQKTVKRSAGTQYFMVSAVLKEL